MVRETGSKKSSKPCFFKLLPAMMFLLYSLLKSLFLDFTPQQRNYFVINALVYHPQKCGLCVRFCVRFKQGQPKKRAPTTLLKISINSC